MRLRIRELLLGRAPGSLEAFQDEVEPVLELVAVVVSGLHGVLGDEGGEVRIRVDRKRLEHLLGGLAVATALTLAVRVVYPRWWFDFARELTRFSARVGAYSALLTDQLPSTVEEQSVHLEIDYPDVKRLNRWLPLVKWLLAIPHYVVLAFLWIGAAVAIVVAWFAILITGRYPRPLFDYVVGVGRWTLRVNAYAWLLVTDRYPPFSLR